MTDTTVKFGLLVSMFQAMLRDRTAAKKRKRFRTFLDRVYTGREYFSAVRLILPGLDRERGTYGLKESTLATCVVDALGLAKDSPDALRLVNWRKGGARSGANAGNFALIAAEVSFSLQTLFCAVLRIPSARNLESFRGLCPNVAGKYGLNGCFTSYLRRIIHCAHMVTCPFCQCFPPRFKLVFFELILEIFNGS